MFLRVGIGCEGHRKTAILRPAVARNAHFGEGPQKKSGQSRLPRRYRQPSLVSHEEYKRCAGFNCAQRLASIHAD